MFMVNSQLNNRQAEKPHYTDSLSTLYPSERKFNHDLLYAVYLVDLNNQEGYSCE